MNGITLMPAPTIEQTPVAVRPARPISRARRGSVGLDSMRATGGFYPHAIVASNPASQEADRRVRNNEQDEPPQRVERQRLDEPHGREHSRDSPGGQSQRCP